MSRHFERFRKSQEVAFDVDGALEDVKHDIVLPEVGVRVRVSGEVYEQLGIEPHVAASLGEELTATDTSQKQEVLIVSPDEYNDFIKDGAIEGEEIDLSSVDISLLNMPFGLAFKYRHDVHSAFLKEASDDQKTLVIAHKGVTEKTFSQTFEAALNLSDISEDYKEVIQNKKEDFRSEDDSSGTILAVLANQIASKLDKNENSDKEIIRKYDKLQLKIALGTVASTAAVGAGLQFAAEYGLKALPVAALTTASFVLSALAHKDLSSQKVLQKAQSVDMTAANRAAQSTKSKIGQAFYDAFNPKGIEAGLKDILSQDSDSGPDTSS